MKAQLKYGIAAYSGTIDEITFASYKNGAVCIARKYVVPTLTEHNTRMGDIAKNLSALYADCSEGYKSDLRTYADIYGKEKSPRKRLNPNAYSLFVKMMYGFAEISGESVDLASITYNDIQTLFVDLTDLASSIEAGYLPKVSNYELLDSAM
jgi:hypothetical protein